MNIYGVIAMVASIIILANFFDAVEPISRFIALVTDIPKINHYGTNPSLYTLIVRLAYLIFVLAVIKMFIVRRKR